MILESLLKGEALHFGYESLMILGFWMLLHAFAGFSDGFLISQKERKEL